MRVLAGKRRRKSPFPSKSAALQYYRDVTEPELRGESPPGPELTLAELVELYLERHAASVRERTIWTLRVRLRYAVTASGDVPLRGSGHERRPRRLASPAAGTVTLWDRVGAPSDARGRRALGYMSKDPAKLAGRNRQPSPRAVRAFTAAEITAISAELSPCYRPLPVFVAATGLRPEEWQALERRDIDRRGRRDRAPHDLVR